MKFRARVSSCAVSSCTMFLYCDLALVSDNTLQVLSKPDMLASFCFALRLLRQLAALVSPEQFVPGGRT